MLTRHAGVAELADALDLGSSVFDVQVQVLSPAPKQYNPNQIFPVGDGFGLFVYLKKFERSDFCFFAIVFSSSWVI